MDGFSETADLLSVIQTCRAQGRSVIEFFKQAMHAMVCPAALKPSLILRPESLPTNKSW